MVTEAEKRRVGALIRHRRQVLDLRQPELAARLGVSRQSVSKWETGLSYPGRSLGKIEDVLGISLTANGTEPSPPTDPRERELWALLAADGLTPAQAWEVIEGVRRTRRRAG